MSGHTKGPWKWESHNGLWGGDRLHDEILSAGDDGSPYGMHCPLIEHHHNDDVAEANRNLIAASPELLDCLKEARKHLDNADIDLAYIDEVIAKAEGRK